MKWYAEAKSFTELLASMFEWYAEMGVWDDRSSDRSDLSDSLDASDVPPHFLT